ncbi:hypothetical protein GOBAR_AA11062 [Gossypium barbadense]|uniref:Zinc finger Sec23/Sec24-type domain-containing protein n=1 Tax=Gossypium barbadense TaxID=3634 RepID=A0A2P5Y1W4_GOSBA|nr:hypothetical protein GOBAR_AA11062 [Gossypium barbadense]
MAVNQTAALKVGLCLLGLCLFGYIVGPPLYWHFMEGLVAFSYTSNTCPPCLCDFSSQPLLTIPEEVCEKKISFSLTFYLDLNKLIKGYGRYHANMVRLFTKAADSAMKGYVGIHSSGFKDFLLKPELLRSIVDSGFKHPSEGKVVDFGETGPVRCSRCKGYINPFMKFIDQERKLICNLCDLFIVFLDLGEFEDGYLDNDGTQELEKYSDDNKELAWMFLLDCAILQAVYMRYGNDDDDAREKMVKKFMNVTQRFIDDTVINPGEDRESYALAFSNVLASKRKLQGNKQFKIWRNWREEEKNLNNCCWQKGCFLPETGKEPDIKNGST